MVSETLSTLYVKRTLGLRCSGIRAPLFVPRNFFHAHKMQIPRQPHITIIVAVYCHKLAAKCNQSFYIGCTSPNGPSRLIGLGSPYSSPINYQSIVTRLVNSSMATSITLLFLRILRSTLSSKINSVAGEQRQADRQDHI